MSLEGQPKHESTSDWPKSALAKVGWPQEEGGPGEGAPNFVSAGEP